MLDNLESRVYVRARLGKDLQGVSGDQLAFYTDYFFNFLLPSYRASLVNCPDKEFWTTLALGYLYSYDRDTRKEHVDG